MAIIRNLLSVLLLCCLWTSGVAQINEVLASFDEYYLLEQSREQFKQDMLELDSLLSNENWRELIGREIYRSEYVQFYEAEGEEGIWIIEFPQLYCNDYLTMRDDGLIANIEALRDVEKIKVPCRGVATDVDIYPERTGDLKKDNKKYLEFIKSLIEENQDVLSFTFKEYKNWERRRQLATEADKFIYRKRFIKYLKEKHFVSAN